MERRENEIRECICKWQSTPINNLLQERTPISNCFCRNFRCLNQFLTEAMSSLHMSTPIILPRKSPWEPAADLEYLHFPKVQKKVFVVAWTLLMWRLTSFEVSKPRLHCVHFSGWVWDFLWRLRFRRLAFRVLWIICELSLTGTCVYARKSLSNLGTRMLFELWKLSLATLLPVEVSNRVHAAMRVVISRCAHRRLRLLYNRHGFDPVGMLNELDWRLLNFIGRDNILMSFR